MNLPDPKDYTNGLQFFVDCHKVVLHNCAELSRVLDDAEARGVFRSFAEQPEWETLFRFFTVDALRHEADETELLFPLLADRVPHVGFQQPGSTIRFLIEGHEVLARQTNVLLHDWEVFRSHPHDPVSLGEAHAKHTVEDATFIKTGRELVRLYREHVALENERVYAVAETVLSGEQKLLLADKLLDRYANEAVTAFYNFDEPQFTDPRYNAQVVPTEAIADPPETEEEEEDADDMANMLK